MASTWKTIWVKEEVVRELDKLKKLVERANSIKQKISYNSVIEFILGKLKQ